MPHMRKRVTTLDFDSVITEIQSNFEYEKYDVERRDLGYQETILTMLPWPRLSGTQFELHVTYRNLVATDEQPNRATGGSS